MIFDLELELICVSRALLISCTFACVRMHLHARHNVISTHITISPFAIRVLRHTSAPQLSHRCPRISQHSVDRNERASLQADWASLSLVHVLFSWRVGLYDFDFWGDLAYTCIVFINTSHEEKTEAHRQGRVNGRVPAPGAVRLLASRPLLPSASAAADIPRCRRGEGPLHGRPGHQAPVPVQMGTVYGSSDRGMLKISNWAGEIAGLLQGEHRARDREARPHPPAARPSSSNSPAQPRHSQCQQLQQAEGQRTHRTHQTQPSRTNHSQREHTTKPVRLIKMSCL